MTSAHRVGLIVPSSNTTMETEIPMMLNRHGELSGEQFTFHSSRTRMRQVNEEELANMVVDSDRCAVEVSDAKVDVIAYACLIAIMAQGPRFHVTSEERLFAAAKGNDSPAPVISSAGALVRGIQALGVSKVAIVAPYMKPLTQLVIEYLSDSGIEVVDSVSLEVPDNHEVAALDPASLPEIAGRLKMESAEAVVLSACVQMPSLPSIQKAEDSLGLPVLSAATSTVFEILQQLDLEPKVPGGGSLLSGSYALP